MLRSAKVLGFSLCTVLKEVMVIAVPLASPSLWVGGSSMVMVQQARLPLCWFLLQFCQHTVQWGPQSDMVCVLRALCLEDWESDWIPERKGKGNTAIMKRGAHLLAMCCMLANPQQIKQKTYLFSLLIGERQGEENWEMTPWTGSASCYLIILREQCPSCFLSLCLSPFPNFDILRCTFCFFSSRTGMVFVCFEFFDKV